MKKFISVLMSVVMVMSILSVGAFAAADNPDEGIMPMYDSSFAITSTLSISNKVATCKSSILMYPNEKWITITQTLEKQGLLGFWSATSHTWTINSSDSASTTTCLFTNTATLTESGNYRVKTVTVCESSEGKRETITTYSKVVSM